MVSGRLRRGQEGFKVEVQATTLGVALTEEPEPAGRLQDALQAWKRVAVEFKSQPPSIWSDRVDAAVKRLSRR